MAGRRGAAARLPEIADKETAPANFALAVGEILDEGDQRWVAPIAIARNAHHLPMRTVEGQSDRAHQAAARIAADDAWPAEQRRPFDRAETFLRGPCDSDDRW